MSRATPDLTQGFTGVSLPKTGPRQMGTDADGKTSVITFMNQVTESAASLHDNQTDTRPDYLPVNGIWCYTDPDGNKTIYQYDGTTDVELWTVEDGETSWASGSEIIHTRQTITTSGTFTALKTGWHLLTCIGGGGAGGSGAGRGGKGGGTTSFGSYFSAIGGGGGGGSGIAANGGTGGGGGGGAGKVTVGYVNLIAGQTVNVTIGAGGLPGTVDMTAATGSGAGGMATGTSRAYGGGSGASGASSGGSGWANTQPEVNQFFGGTGGSGGSNGTGYGGGGGGKGGNGNYCQATGGTGGDNGKNGGAGVTANATIISGGAGGSGAVIIEY